MRLFGPAPLPLDQRLQLDTALADAFAPLRARTAGVGPARIRAAVRWTDQEPGALRGFALIRRVSDLSIAAAISAFLFAGTVASIEPSPSIPDVSRNTVSADAWMLNGRIALQRPIDSLATDYRTTAGDVAENAATARRPEAELRAPAVRDTEPFSHRP